MKFTSAVTPKGNSSTSDVSQEEADAQASALDANGCRDCTNCTNCSNCRSCRGCRDCMGCRDCQGCNNCHYCRDCRYCRDSHRDPKTATPKAVTEYMKSVRDQHLSHDELMAALDAEFDAIPFLMVLTEVMSTDMTGNDTIHFFCTDHRNYGRHSST